jgi:hypothetical protein
MQGDGETVMTDTDQWDPKTFSRSQFLEVEDATAQVGTYSTLRLKTWNKH